MPNYRRNYLPGGTYFFTVVTHQRRPILTTPAARFALRRALQEVQQTRPYEINAIVLLPDHLHTVWTLPSGDSDYSTRWRRIKSLFTSAWLQSEQEVTDVSESRSSKGEQGVWQRRFYEHTCQDNDDWRRCIDYVHVNPLKHGLVERVGDWPWSSFHRWRREGEYGPDWGSAAEWYGDEWERCE